VTDKRAVAIRKIAEGLYELADVLFDQPGQATETSRGTGVAPSGNPAPVTPTPVYPPGPASADLPPAEDWGTETSLLDEIFPADVKAPPREETPQGSLARCPSHDVLFKDGRFGKYCPSLSKDPAWANKKGYCTITPKNVDIWLRSQAALA
jgi:hypothetical protein